MSEDNQLGSLLIARGLLTPEQLEAALEEQERTHRSLGRVLIDQGLVCLPSLRREVPPGFRVAIILEYEAPIPDPDDGASFFILRGA